MTREGSSEPPAPVLFHVKTAEMRGRGERIRTSGPCLPNALPLPSCADLWRFSLGARCPLVSHVRGSFTDGGSIRTFNPCA
jgi:hypothetical protein